MDNHHVRLNSSFMSCGVAELSDIGGDIKKVLYSIATNLYHPSRGSPYAIICWSDLVEHSNGATLGNLIMTGTISGLHVGFLGQCFMSLPVENPKTGNAIKCWWWNVDHDAFKKWYITERVARAKKL